MSWILVFTLSMVSEGSTSRVCIGEGQSQRQRQEAYDKASEKAQQEDAYDGLSGEGLYEDLQAEGKEEMCVNGRCQGDTMRIPSSSHPSRETTFTT